MPRYVDLSHPIVTGGAGYPGLPVPRIEPWKSYAASRGDYGGEAEFEITRLFLVGNTGTYLDSPSHRFAGAADVAGLDLAGLAGLPALCLPVPRGAHGALARDVRDADLRGRAVLLRTGWSVHWGTARYWHRAPSCGGELAASLVAAGVALVGIDAPNVDDTADRSRPAHTSLLRAGIPIVEHLRDLGRLPAGGFRFFAVPAPIRGATALPVRAFAELPDAIEDEPASGGF